MSEMVEVKVPNIGDFDEVEIIEVLVSVGDQIAEEDSLITVESDKASMEIPSSHGGTVKDVKVKVGDSIAEGAVVVVIEATAAAADEPVKVAEPEAPATVEKLPGKTAPIAVPKIQAKSSPTANIDRVSFKNAHASPAVRKFARELGVDLSKVGGTGRNARIIKGDVQGFVKQVVSSGASSSGAGLGVEAMPDIDFSKF
ncbi:Dihydrolipoamide acetyltransferase component of pyruvate dehydrogenase complex, partial [hydrothermal vent metagenome]